MALAGFVLDNTSSLTVVSRSTMFANMINNGVLSVGSTSRLIIYGKFSYSFFNIVTIVANWSSLVYQQIILKPILVFLMPISMPALILPSKLSFFSLMVNPAHFKKIIATYN
jgi:ABC-type polysaccharide/polyol phosphate export permease